MKLNCLASHGKGVSVARRVAVVVLIGALLAPWAAVPRPSAHGAEVANLKDTLEKGLKARFPGDFQFIQKVVQMVQLNQLPLDMVLGTFHWVRTEKAHKKYKVPYFAKALRSRAKKKGIIF